MKSTEVRPLQQTHDIRHRAENFSIDEIVQRYSVEEGLSPDVAKDHERELKRFLIVSALSPTKTYATAGPTDDLWHKFILSTREYVEFCESVCGEYIHHSPCSDMGNEPADRTAAKEEMLNNYRAFLIDYESVFDEVPPEHIWPRPFDYTGMLQQPTCIVNCEANVVSPQ